MRIIHFSDFHLLGGTQFVRSKDLCDNLCDAFERINKEKKVDFVICSGDLIDKGGQDCASIGEAFSTFKSVIIDTIVNRLVNPSHFLFVPGNHDIDNSVDNKEQEKKLFMSLKDTNSLDKFMVSCLSETMIP